MAYSGATPTSVPLSGDDLSDGIISEAKLADDAVSLAKMKAGVDGTIISFDASTNPVAIATGNSGQYLKSAGSGQPPVFAALPAGVSVHVGAFTRDSAAATASVAYTGVGFQPKAIMFISHIENADQISWGFDDGTTANNKYDNSGGSDDTWASAGSKSIMARESSGNYQTGGVSAFGADGFTISWVKAGSASGLQYITYLAIG